MIYAGVDTNGTSHNSNSWIVPGGGGGLYQQPDGSLRVCQLRHGVVTMGVKNPASYSRPMTKATFRPPFEVSGEIMLHSRMDDVIILGENRKPTWEWFPNFHPAFVDEDNNVITGCSISKNGWTASGQIDHGYGIPRDFVYVKRPDTLEFGRWYRFRMIVPIIGTHEVYIDDQLVYRVVEKTPPARWWNRPIHAALRLDFYDYSLRNLTPGDAPMTAMYPIGYGHNKVNMEAMRLRHEPHMHPEFARRLFAYLEHKNGLLGIGGGYRPPGTQPDGTPGFAPPGKSFHEGQSWASGLVAYAAVDLVKPNPFNAGADHVAPAWADTADAPDWGLHTFITGEPWHIQPVEIRGWQTWVDNGRKDPEHFTLPGEQQPPPPPPPPPTEEVDMIVLDWRFGKPEWTALISTGTHLAWVVDGNADAVFRSAGVKRVPVNDAQLDGVIKSSVTTSKCPSTFTGARKTAWDSQRGCTWR